MAPSARTGKPYHQRKPMISKKPNFEHGMRLAPLAAESARERSVQSAFANDEVPPTEAPLIFVHEPYRSPRTTALRVGIIADGTSRGGPNGLAEGAARVVECAEHCAARSDVSLLSVFVLSPENLERRKAPFFAALHAEFLRLLEAVSSGRCLVGVRVELSGTLDRLVAKGGAATRLAHVLGLLRTVTASVAESRLTLVFGVDYGADSALALGLDVLIRTGMEESCVLRLSGLRVQPCTLCVPSERLWRHFSAADLDDALALAARHRRSSFAPGYSVDFVLALLSALRERRSLPPVRLVLPVVASPAEVGAALALVADARLRSSDDIAVRASALPGRPPRRFGPADARICVYLSLPGLNASRAMLGDAVAWLTPGQPSPVFRLRERGVAYANVHTCAPTPAGVVDGLERALLFHTAHPPLHGAPRATIAATLDAGAIESLFPAVAERMDASSEALSRELLDVRIPQIERVSRVFAVKCLCEARAIGLESGEVDWRRQAFGYALTAFAIAGPSGEGRADARPWEPAARVLARVMLALAASDEESTDRVFPAEGERERQRRLASSVAYLIARVRGEACSLPVGRGSAVLAAIGEVWTRFFAEVSSAAAPAFVAAVRAAAEALYRANLEELSPAGSVFPPVERVRSAGGADAVEQAYAAAAPALIAQRMRTLLQCVRDVPPDECPTAWPELRLLGRLTRVAPSIGAGCALSAMAATEPAEAIPEGAAAAFLEITPMLDFYFRLVNDLAFTDMVRGDRDDKVNAFTCLLTPSLTGEARECDCVAALAMCRSVAAWLREELERAIGELAVIWPTGARWLRRGMHIGRRVYERGHYERLGPDALLRIAAELESLPAPEAQHRDGVVV